MDRVMKDKKYLFILALIIELSSVMLHGELKGISWLTYRIVGIVIFTGITVDSVKKINEENSLKTWMFLIMSLVFVFYSTFNTVSRIVS